MNYGRVVLAGLAGAVAYFVCGGVISGQLIAKEHKPYEGVYRSREAIMHYFPMGIAATFIAIIILAAIYAKGYEGGSGALEGLRFGALIGIFIVFAQARRFHGPRKIHRLARHRIGDRSRLQACHT